VPAWVERNRSLAVGAALVALWLGVAAVLAVFFSGRIRDWSVMTDELLYAKLATSIADSGSPLPSVHGTSIAVYNQLYPLLLAPFYGTLSPPDAFRVAHVLNAFLMASAAFPAYLLARQLVGRAWSFGVAALSILVPWMIVTGFLMTEVVAYPAFLWAVLGLQLAIAAPTGRRDLLAVGALALAVLARTQFAALAVVLPLAILGHEVGYARSVRTGMRAAFERHRLLAAIYALGAAAVVVVAAVDSTGGVLGVYAVTVEEGSLLPSGIWSSAAEHLDAVAIGCGLLPFLLGGGWLLATLARPRSRAEHAFATLALLTVAALTFEVASFSVRFGADLVRDRYLFYVVPLLLVGSAAALSSARSRAVALAAGLVTLFFAATAASLPFTAHAGVWIDSPASVLNDLLIEQSGDLGTGTFVALLGLFVGVVLALALLLVPRRLLEVAVLGTLVLFSILTLRSEVDRVVGATGLSGRPLAEPPGVVLDWVDTVVPEGEQAAVAAFPVSTAWDTTAIRWWDAEFWSRRTTHAYVATDTHFTYTPFPAETLNFDPKTGVVADTDNAPAYVLGAPGDYRFELAGSTVAENVGLVVRSVERPYRALWSIERLEPDGWTRPGDAAWMTVHGRGRVRARLTLTAPRDDDARYRIAAKGQRREGTLAAGTGRTVVVTGCAPYSVLVNGTSDAQVPALQLSPTVEGTRSVGVLVGPIKVKQLPRPC
jgi:hypothetical protein